MAGITEAKVYEALGLGAKAQEVATPADPASVVDTAADDTGTGAQVQEVADPASAVETDPAPGTQTEVTAATADPEDPESNAETGAGAGQNTQTAEERRANAARRREQERQAAIDEAVRVALAGETERREAAFNEFFATAGLQNTITGEPITNMDQYRAWQAQYRNARLESELQAGKLTKETLDQLIAEHPSVKRAEQVADAEKASQEHPDSGSKPVVDAVFMASVDQQIAEISKLDPTIQSPADLLQMPDAREFRDIINRTRCSFLEAFKLLRMDKITASQVGAARQQALNNNRGKDHLQPTGNSRGSGAASVPDAEMKMYRLFNPDATEAQIQQHFNKHLKK